MHEFKKKKKRKGPRILSYVPALGFSSIRAIEPKKDAALACIYRSTMLRSNEKRVPPAFPARLWTGRCDIGRALASQILFRGLWQPQNAKKRQCGHLCHLRCLPPVGLEGTAGLGMVGGS